MSPAQKSKPALGGKALCPGPADRTVMKGGHCETCRQAALCHGTAASAPNRGVLDDAPRESEDRIHALFEGVETGLFIIDPETHRLIDANSVAARMVGVPREQIVGSLCHKFVCPAEEGHCPVTDLGQAVVNSERVLLTAFGERRAIIKTVRSVTMSGRQLLLESFVDVTALKSAETALKERTAYLHLLIEVCPLGILVLDAAEQVMLSNAAFETLFLYTQEEAKGAHWSNLISPDGSDREMSELARQCLEQGSVQVTTRRRRKDGSLVDVRIFAAPLKIDGRPSGFLALYEDIGAEIQAVKSLRESEDRFRTAFEDAPYGMAMTAPDGHFLHANAALCAMLGYSADELLTGAWQQLTHPDDVAISREAGIRLHAGNAVVELEKRYLHKKGSVVWARVKIMPVKQPGGEISHFVTQVEDISQRKQADEAKAFLASLVASSPDAIIGESLDGMVMSWNRGAEQLYGYSAEEMIGKPISRLVPPDCAEEAQEGMEAAGGSGLVIRYETVRVRKDGMRIDISLTLSPVCDAAGKMTAIATIAHDITERRFREEQTHLQTAALESTANGMMITDCNGKILWVNPAFTRLTGYTAEEVLDQNPRVLKSGIHDGAFYRNLWSTISRGETWRGEVVNRRKDGSLYHEAMSITPVRSADGCIHHFVAVKEDITERKRAQEELLFKTALLETEAETTIDGILVVDQHGQRLQSNRRFAEIFKIPPELLASNDDQKMLGYVSTQLEDPEAFRARVEYLYTHESEKARDEIQLIGDCFLDRYTAPLHDASGKYYGRVWYFRDITGRKRAEQALRESEQRYRELFENASEIIFASDLEGRLTSLNRAGERVLGYSPDEASQTDFLQIVAPEYRETLEHDRARMMGGASELTSEIEVVAKDGRRVRLEVKPRLVRRDGKPVGIQAIARDITGRDLAEMELRQAQKLESVGRLASGIAHEINTPIQFVGDNTRFIEDSFASLRVLLVKFAALREAAASGAVSPELLNEVRAAEQEADCAYLLEEIPRAIAQTMEGVDRVATIVRAMKEFAHPESKEMAPVDLNKALLSTITVARNEWKYVADVDTELAELPLVVCNVGDLNQVFLNLLVNAAHAIADVVKDGGKGHIAIRTATEGDKVHVSIADTGTGIPENIRTRIFDPFFTTKEVGRGTGQGLAIARSVVVERHKGALTFESEVGKGTTFHIYLPISPQEPSTEIECL